MEGGISSKKDTKIKKKKTFSGTEGSFEWWRNKQEKADSRKGGRNLMIVYKNL